MPASTSTTPSLPRSSSCVRSGRRGFALLITITLLAFLVLLLVSLAALTRVETQVASNGQQLAQARQNALMALNIALGQLQKYAGPDQRVTGTADLVTGNLTGGRITTNSSANATVGARKYWDTTNTLNGLNRVQAGTRYWTGVWGNLDSSTPTVGNGNIYEKTPRPVLLNWLVSGNEAAAFTPVASGTFGQVNAGTGITKTPVTAATPAITTTTKATDVLTLGAGKAVLLVGASTAGTQSRTVETTLTETAMDRYVIAPLVDINVDNATLPGLGTTGTSTVGRYAWWVGDEGVKARVNMIDPYASQNTPATQVAARYRLMTAARSGAEVDADFAANATLPASYINWSQSTTLNPVLKRVQALRQFPLLDSTNIAFDPTTAGPVRLADHVHDFSPSSAGIQADSYNGGLRKDLTYYLERNKNPAVAWGTGWKSSWNPTAVANDAGEAQGILPAAYSPVMGALTGDTRIPKWDVVRSFYGLPSKTGNTLTGVAATDTVTIQAASATQVGIAPMVVQMRILIGGAGNKDATPSSTTPPLAAQSYRMLMNTLVVLANPYTSKLSAPAGIDFTLRNDLRLKYSDNVFKFQGGVNGTHEKWPFNDLATGAGTSTLHIPAFILEPGESAAFFVQGAQKISGGNIDLVRLNLGSGAVPNPTGTLIDYIYQDYAGWTADANFHFSETGGNSTILVEFTMPGTTQILQQLGGLNIDRSTVDYPSSENTNAFPQGTPMAGCVYQIKYNTPAETYPAMSGTISAGEANSSLRGLVDFNPRAGYYRQTNYGNFSGPYCESFMSGGNTSGKLSSFSTDLVTLYWGRSTAAATGTVQKSILFDIPRWNGAAINPELEQPIISLGALQHVNLTAEDIPSTSDVSPWVGQTTTGTFNAFTAQFGSPSGGYATSTVNALSTPLPPNPGHQPAYAFANSYAPIFLPREKTVQARTDTWQSRIRDNNETPATATRNYYDISYLLNTALWDGYFFSTIPQSGGIFAPLSPRLGQRADITGLTANDVRNGEKAAAYTLINGAFNINSTSVDAWVALLAGMKNLPRLPNLSAGSDPNTATVFPRTLRQTTAAATTPTLTGDDSYTGYRQLSDAEIRTLALELVKQVRMRGPFLSLSQFVNRVLVTAALDGTQGVGQMGALQKAIDNAGLNNGPAGFTTADKAIVPIVTDSTNNVVSEAGSRGTNSLYADTSSTETPTALQRSTAIPGWLTQADVLQAIAPVLSARSDTFVIRTYGEVKNPATTDTTARAWCEAVVQRMPDYVDAATNSSEVAPVSASVTNRAFGRRFTVISFRWLTPGDI